MTHNTTHAKTRLPLADLIWTCVVMTHMTHNSTCERMTHMTHGVAGWPPLPACDRGGRDPQ